MPASKNKIKVTITIEPELLKQLDALAGRAGLSRSHVAELLLTDGVDELNMLERLGLSVERLKLAGEWGTWLKERWTRQTGWVKWHLRA